MRKTILPLIILFTLQLSAGQAAFRPGMGNLFLPKEATIFYKLGDRVIQIKTFQYGEAKDKVYINLHDDEITAINGARKVLEKKGGYLIKIENYRTRNIKFKLEGKYYTIDPNRMFSRIGIARSLIIFGNTSPKAINEIEKFANRILQLIPENPFWIIALHNNTNGKYSINSYLPGADKGKDAKSLNVNQELDADDFFLTTDSILFSRLTNEKYNTILQDNEKAKKDGSLSVYCGERNIHYVNCETEHGRQPEYDEMIAVASEDVEVKYPETSIATATGTEVKKPDLIVPTNKTEAKKPDVIIPANKTEGKKPDMVVATNKTEAKKSDVIAGANKIETKTPDNSVYKKNPDMIAYNYRIMPTNGHISPKANAEILFGEKKIGFIRSVLADSSKTISGKLEMNKDFALYSNMDFFVFVSPTNPLRFEMRIDPTRKKELVNPKTAIINITTRTAY